MNEWNFCSAATPGMISALRFANGLTSIRALEKSDFCSEVSSFESEYSESFASEPCFHLRKRARGRKFSEGCMIDWIERGLIPSELNFE